MSAEIINSNTNGVKANDNGQTASTNERKVTIQDIPRLPREITPFASFISVVEVNQYGPLFQGPGSKKETGRYKVRPADEEIVKRAKKFAAEQSIKHVMLKQHQNQQRAQLEAMKKQQALLLMCRTYIGSINFELTEAMLKQAFQPFGPVKSVSLTFDSVTNRHKGFAFLEYETPEAAQLSIEQMNGVVLGGRNIKVGRPSNMPQAQPIIDQLTEEAKNYNRIYVASIHSDLTENDIKSVFEAFGTIKSCSLSKDATTGKHKGYGFIEYETAQAAKDAISAMNLFDLGGQLLRVGKAITPPEGTTTAPPVAPVVVPTAMILNQPAILPQTVISYDNMNGIQTISNPTGMLPGVVNHDTLLNPLGVVSNTVISKAPINLDSIAVQKLGVPTPTPPPPPPPRVIVPPVPLGMTPQPRILEEPPIPVEFRGETQQTNNHKIALSLPTKETSKKVDVKDIQKPVIPISNSEESAVTLSQQEELSVRGREQRHLLMQKLNQRLLDSRICILRNMIGPEQVDEVIEEEVKDECTKYGSVSQVIIYIEKQNEDETTPEIVKIFVEFENSKGAEKACQSLNGRWFAGRMIQAEIYDEAAFAAQDFSG